MAQGKAWTSEQKEIIVRSLKPYLEMGFSRNKACAFVGLAPTTLSEWVKADDALRMELVGAENAVNTVAIQNIADSVRAEGNNEKDLRKENSKWWAERRMKKDFSLRSEVSMPEGISIQFDSAFKDREE